MANQFGLFERKIVAAVTGYTSAKRSRAKVAQMVSSPPSRCRTHVCSNQGSNRRRDHDICMAPTDEGAGSDPSFWF